MMAVSRNMVYPMAGGLYDQDPLFLIRFKYFLSEKGHYESQKADREKRTKGGPPVKPRNA